MFFPIQGIKLKSVFNRAAEKLTELLPDFITGSTDLMQKKYRAKFGQKDCRLLIKQRKEKVMKYYLLIFSIFIVMISGSTILSLFETREITHIRKPAYGEKDYILPVEAELEYKGIRQSERIRLKIREKALNDDEKKEVLLGYTKQLEQLIIGENPDLEHVEKTLNLVGYDLDTGISIHWTSSHPKIIDEKGNVDLLESEGIRIIELKADLTLDDVSITETYKARIAKNPSSEALSQSMNHRLNEEMKELTAGGSTPNIPLPAILEEGVSVRWYLGKSNRSGVLLIVFIISIMVIYLNRYDTINRDLKTTEESIIKELPEFMNKLVLLLNAGLVVSTAISKIVEDYHEFHKNEDKLNKTSSKKGYLYEELYEIQRRVNRSNASLIKELKDLSQRSGVRELVRLTAVISDNWDKGSMLAEKLEGESELLWINRKKRAEEKGRLAETKLTFPLMILLIVLITVTISPALMGM